MKALVALALSLLGVGRVYGLYREPIVVRENHEMHVKLFQSAGTGFEWMWENEDELKNIISLVNEETEGGPTIFKPGQSVKKIFTFKALVQVPKIEKNGSEKKAVNKNSDKQIREVSIIIKAPRKKIFPTRKHTTITSPEQKTPQIKVPEGGLKAAVSSAKAAGIEPGKTDVPPADVGQKVLTVPVPSAKKDETVGETVIHLADTSDAKKDLAEMKEPENQAALTTLKGKRQLVAVIKEEVKKSVEAHKQTFEQRAAKKPARSEKSDRITLKFALRRAWVPKTEAPAQTKDVPVIIKRGR